MGKKVTTAGSIACMGAELMDSGHRSDDHEMGLAVSRALETVKSHEGLSREHLVVLARAIHKLGKAAPEFAEAGRPEGAETFPGGRARKISVSMPEDISAAVQSRVGRGEFSRHVTEAVARQLEADLLAELVGLLDEEHGEVSEDLIAEAEGAWPDAE
jgi:Arc/MetJ-type ribon-helix-helix transcriptional regulator